METKHLCGVCGKVEIDSKYIVCEECELKAQTPKAFEEARKLHEEHLDPWYKANEALGDRLMGKTLTWVNGAAKICASGHPLGSIMHSELCNALRMGLCMGFMLSEKNLLDLPKIPRAFISAFGEEAKTKEKGIPRE